MITIPSRFVIFGQKWAKIEKIDLKIFCWPERKWGVLFDHGFIRVSWLGLEFRIWTSDCSHIASNSCTSNYPSWYAKFGSSIHRPIRSNSLMALVWSGRRNRFFLARVWTENSILMLVPARFLLIRPDSICGFLVWMQHFLVTRLYRKNRNWNRFQV